MSNSYLKLVIRKQINIDEKYFSLAAGRNEKVIRPLLRMISDVSYRILWMENMTYNSFFYNNYIDFYDTGELKTISLYYVTIPGENEEGNPFSIYSFYKSGRLNEFRDVMIQEDKEITAGDHIINYDNGIMKLREKYVITPDGKNALKRSEEYDLEGNIIDLASYDVEGVEFSYPKYTSHIVYYPNRVMSFCGFFYEGKAMYNYLYDVLEGPFFENEPNGSVTVAGYYVDGLLEGFYLEKEGGQVKRQGVYEVRRCVSIKTDYWLEMEKEELIEVYYGLTKELISFPPII